MSRALDKVYAETYRTYNSSIDKKSKKCFKKRYETALKKLDNDDWKRENKKKSDIKNRNLCEIR